MLQGPDGVGRYPTPVARVEILVGVLGLQSEGDNPARAKLDTLATTFVDGAIGSDDKINIGEQVAVRLDAIGNMGAADLILPFQEHDHIAGDFTRYCQP